MKTCVKCSTQKTLDLFSRKSSTKDGLDYYCKDCRNQSTRVDRKENLLERQKRCREYQSRNKEIIKQKNLSRREQIKAYQRDRKRKKYNSDPLFKLACNIRRATSQVFRGKKSKKTLDMLGCSFEELKTYLQAQFKPGMTWENYGKWHIDHIYPVSLAKSSQELEKLCNYNNLQPLWAIDNIKKSNKVT